MKKLNIQLILSLILFNLSSVCAQNEKNIDDEIQVLKDKIRSLEIEKTKQSSQIKQLDKRIKTLKDSIDYKIDVNAKEIKTIDKKLSYKIDLTDSSATRKYSDLDKTMSNNTIYWIIGFLLIACLLTVVYYVLKKLINLQKTNVDEKISKTRRELEEEGIKLDNKLIEIMNSQLKLLNIDKSKETEEKDHSLALKVADEIVRIEKNLSNMDSNLKGHKQLEASVNRIRDNFAASGYEIVDMLNKPYTEGINANVNFRTDENLKKEQQIVTRIIKPQVNYQGKMIQPSQIEVSQGE